MAERVNLPRLAFFDRPLRGGSKKATPGRSAPRGQRVAHRVQTSILLDAMDKFASRVLTWA